jgi:hypothetical protein
MEDRWMMLSNFAQVVREEGPMGLSSCEVLKDMIAHHFDLGKHEFYAYSIYLDPFVVIFSDQHARDVMFAAGRAIEGPIELSFSA